MKGDVMKYFNDYAKQNLILVNHVVKPAGTDKIMSSADDISLWYEAVQYYDAGKIDEAIDKFENVKKNAKMLTNIGCCYLRKNDLKSASEIFEKVVSNDRYMALGFFLLALTEYFQDKYESAFKNFEKTFELLRGNKFVDYRQLGFKYQLYSCEVLTNLAAVNVKLGKMEKAKEYLVKAFENKSEKKHERIFTAIEGLQNGVPIQLFLPPKSEIFRPSKAAVANIKKKDFLGTAKVISTDSEEDCYACFSGIKDKVIEQKKAEAEIKNQTKFSSTADPSPSPPLTKPRSQTIAPMGPPPSFDAIYINRERSRTLGEIPYKPLPQMIQPIRPLPISESTIEKSKEPECQSEIKNQINPVDKPRIIGVAPPVQAKSSSTADPSPSPPLTKPRSQTIAPMGPPPSFDAIYVNRERSRTLGAKPNKPLPQMIQPIRPLPISESTIENNKEPECQSAIGPVIINEREGIEIEVEYRFIKKVRLPTDFTLDDLENATMQQCIPKQVEFRLADRLGRQTPLTNDTLLNLFDTSVGKRIQCFSMES